MADAFTPNFNFTLPEVGASEDTWGTKLHANWTSADTLIAARALNATVFTAGTGLTGGGDLSAARSFALTGQALALHNLATTGFVSRTGAATFATRTLTAGDGVGVTNGDGIAGNPTVAVDATVVRTTGTQTIGGSKTFSSAIVGSVSFQAPAADTVAVPGFTWVGDLTTGMYRISAGAIGFASGGVLAATINASGFSGNGSQLTGLNATALSSGTILDARLAATIVRSNTITTYTALQTFSSGISTTTFAASGQALISGGTVAAPGLAFSADTDTGLQMTSAGTMNFVVTGATRAWVNATGIAGNGSQLTTLNASNLSSGTVADGRLSTNVALLNATQTFTGTFTFNNTVTGATFNATSTSGGGFQGIDADTALAPSFTWTADQNTGIWRPAADQIGFTTGGTNRITISSTGIAGAGGGLTGLNATQLTTGTTPIARIPLATQAEAEAGTIVTKVMTPLQTAQAIAALGSSFTEVGPTTVSGTGILFTGLPTGINRIEIIFNGTAQANSNNWLRVRLRTGGVTTSAGYYSYSSRSAIEDTTAFVITLGQNGKPHYGIMTLERIPSSHIWVCTHLGTEDDTVVKESYGSGRLNLATSLDGLSILPATSNFSGSGNITLRYYK